MKISCILFNINLLIFRGLCLPSWTKYFIQDFFNIYNIHVIQLITCYTNDAVHIMKDVEQFWFKISYNITFDDNRQGIFIDVDCQVNRNLLTQVSYDRSENWIIWSTMMQWDQLNLSFQYCSSVVWATPQVDNSVLLHYLQYTAEGILPHISDIDMWDTLTRNIRKSYPEKIDLQGIPLIGSVVINELKAQNEEELKLMLLDDKEKGTEIMAKLNYGLWHILERKFNFSIQLIVTDSYGYQINNGSFDGIIGALSRNEAELGISAVRALPNRGEYVEFVGPTWLFRSSMLFLHPKIQGVRSVLVQPFSYPLWAMIGLTGFIVIVLLKITSWFEVNSDHKSHEAEDSWTFSIMVTISALCDQGSDVILHWVTWRIAFFTFLVLAVLLNSFYSAAVVSFLLRPPTKTIHTAKDLTKSNLKVAMTTISYNMDFFMTTNVPDIKDLFHKKIFPKTQSSPNAYHTDVAFKKLKDENYAIHTESITLYPKMDSTFNEQQRCALTEIELFPSKMLFVMVKKRSQYGDVFKQGFNRLKEHGILYYETLKWRPQRPMCANEDDELNSVDLDAVSLAFIILLTGIILSLVFLVIETAGYRLHDGKYMHYIKKLKR